MFTPDLKARKVTMLDTPNGYMQVLEYILPDTSILYAVQWHFTDKIEENSLIPMYNCETFYNDDTSAMKLAEKIGQQLLKYNKNEMDK